MALPRLAALKSKYNEKYLRFIAEGDHKNYVQYSGDDLVSIFTKYELEPATTGSGLFHIRSCYNNKYWVSFSETHHYVVASSDKPEEDKSKWSCTLFQPIYDSTHQAYRFLHVNLGYNACLWRDGSNLLFMGYSSPDKDLCDLHEIVDWESLVVLPKHIAFKGDNGLYLCAYWYEEHMFLRFWSTDIGAPDIRNEASVTSDGNLRFKLVRSERFWRLSPSWIWADTYDTTSNNKDTLFVPVKVSPNSNVIALRNLGNNRYCMRLTTEGKTNCLNAGIDTITSAAHLEVHEYVLSREIYNVKFRPEDGRVYGEKILTLTHGDAVNDHSEPDSIGIKLSYTTETIKTWNSSISMKLTVETTIMTGIPVIAEGKITISGEFSGSYTWGATETTSSTVETEYSVTVPPMTKLKVNLLASRGICDVPFSYTQRDVLTDGTKIIEDYHDGVYTGVNYYNFKYETKPYE